MADSFVRALMLLMQFARAAIAVLDAYHCAYATSCIYRNGEDGTDGSKKYEFCKVVYGNFPIQIDASQTQPRRRHTLQWLALGSGLS